MFIKSQKSIFDLHVQFSIVLNWTELITVPELKDFKNNKDIFNTEPFLGAYNIIISNGLAFINRQYLIAKTDDPLSLQKAETEHKHDKYFESKFDTLSMPILIKNELFDLSFGWRENNDFEFGIINVVCRNILSIAISTYGNRKSIEGKSDARNCSVEIFNFDLHEYTKPKYELSFFQKNYNIRDISGKNRYGENQYIHFNW